MKRAYEPTYTVSAKAMNMIAEIAAAGEGSQKSSQKILSAMRAMPDVTMAELANATGLSIAGIKKNIRKLKDANLIRRVGPDKGGHWEVVE